MAVDYIRRDGIGYVTINNPSKANILDRQTSNDISEIWKDIWEDPDVRAVILTGTGDRHFCAGHNLDSRPDITAEERERIRAENIFSPSSSRPTSSSALAMMTGNRSEYFWCIASNSSRAPGISALLQTIIVGLQVYVSVAESVSLSIPSKSNPHSDSSDNDSSV